MRRIFPFIVENAGSDFTHFVPELNLTDVNKVAFMQFNGLVVIPYLKKKNRKILISLNLFQLMWFWLLFLHCYPSQLVQISLLTVNVSIETKTQTQRLSNSLRSGPLRTHEREDSAGTLFSFMPT